MFQTFLLKVKTYPKYSFKRHSLQANLRSMMTECTEASKFECWSKAMETELTALEQTGTWKLVD
jgi:hypothetical protein